MGASSALLLLESFTNLSTDKSLKAGLEVVDATLVEFGHLVQQLLVLGLEVLLDWLQLFFCLECGGKMRNKSMGRKLPVLNLDMRSPELVNVVIHLTKNF